MKTKFIVALASLAICICSSMQAQQPERMKKERVFPNEKMIKELKLNDNQVAEIKKATETLKTEIKALKAKEIKNKKEKAEAINKIKEAYSAKIKKSLSNDQYIKFLECKVENLQKEIGKNRMRKNHIDKKEKKCGNDCKEVKSED